MRRLSLKTRMHPMNRWPALAEFRTLGAHAARADGHGVADAIMAGRLSATDLAGIALGGFG